MKIPDAKAYCKCTGDGTVAVLGESMEKCRESMQSICNKLKVGCDHWRLLVNCEPNKTEIIAVKGKGLLDIQYRYIYPA